MLITYQDGKFYPEFSMSVPHLVGMNGGVQSDLFTLKFKNREQLEYFRRIIIRLQKEIILSGETISPKRLIFHYMKALSDSNKLKAFIATNMIDLITFLDNNVKTDVYKVVKLQGLYRYI